jgi:hypothetical protein
MLEHWSLPLMVLISKDKPQSKEKKKTKEQQHRQLYSELLFK